jgi:hypothetical protein
MNQMKTIQDWHAELQQNFMKIVTKMVESNCALPNDFTLFYKLKEEMIDTVFISQLYHF